MINAISAAAIAFIMSSSPLIECSRPIRFFIVSVMYNNSGDSDSDSNSDNDSNGNSNSNHFIEVSKLLAELRYTNQIKGENQSTQRKTSRTCDAESLK